MNYKKAVKYYYKKENEELPENVMPDVKLNRTYQHKIRSSFLRTSAVCCIYFFSLGSLCKTGQGNNELLNPETVATVGSYIEKRVEAGIQHIKNTKSKE